MARAFLAGLTMIALLASSGCGLTLGPTVEERVLVIHNGKPVQIVQNATVKGKALDGDVEARVDVGGWIAMPPDHWDWVKEQLEK